MPLPGTTIEVAPGVHWLSMPLPFQLDHINLWVLEEPQDQGQGRWTIVDTGIGNEQTRGLWEKIFSSRNLSSVKRVILTHYHPDHAGNAAWLCKRFGAEMWTTQGEYLTAHAVRASGAGYTAEAVLSVFKKNGLDEERSRTMSALRGNNRYSELVPEFPFAYRRIIEGDTVRIGGRAWKAMIGHGHAPEHLSLYCAQLNALIAGDMLLSTISTNVSVWSIDPEGDPLRLFLDSIARYRDLPAGVLVLPSHGKPFRGLHTRIGQLKDHHSARLAEVLQACFTPQSAVDIVPIMFKRALDTHQLSFALGEALAHLHKLWRDGVLRRRKDADGIIRFQIL